MAVKKAASKKRKKATATRRKVTAKKKPAGKKAAKKRKVTRKKAVTKKRATRKKTSKKKVTRKKVAKKHLKLLAKKRKHLLPLQLLQQNPVLRGNIIAVGRHHKHKHGVALDMPQEPVSKALPLTSTLDDPGYICHYK